MIISIVICVHSPDGDNDGADVWGAKVGLTQEQILL